MGGVDGFSWGQVAVGGLTAGFVQGLGGMAAAGRFGESVQGALSATTPTFNQAAMSYAAQGVFSYASSYATNRIVGVDNAFSWRNVAASVAGVAIAGSLGKGGGLLESIIRGQVSAYSAAVIKDKWFGGSKASYSEIAADAFGNSLAEFVVKNIRQSGAASESLFQVLDENSRTAQILSSEGYSSEQIQRMLNSGCLSPRKCSILERLMIRERHIFMTLAL